MTKTQTPTQSLYQRLGGGAAIARIARDIIALHQQNPVIKTRFEAVDIDELERHVITFIGAGTGGPEAYEGRDMAGAHKNMNINERELIAAVDDVLKALIKNGVKDPERNEMLAILYSLKDEVMFK